MNWIYPKQLYLDLETQLKSVYVLFGNNFCLLQDIQSHILKTIHTLYRIEKLKIELDMNSNWNEIFIFCKTITLFSQKKILLLNCSKNYPIHYFNKNLSLLSSFIRHDLILILLVYTSYQSTKYTTWVQNLNKTAVLVNCLIPEHNQSEIWIKNQSDSMKLTIENLACQLLCYYYEGNNVLLQQILQYLSLVYPDGNLNFLRVKKVINDSAFFNYNHWIESILIGKKQRANRILKQLEYININWKTLLYKIQCEILIIIKIKYNLIKKQSLSILFRKHQIYTEYHRLILFKAIQKFDLNKLHVIVSILVQMELKYHKHFLYLTRADFEFLTEIFCNTNNTLFTQQFFINNII